MKTLWRPATKADDDTVGRLVPDGRLPSHDGGFVVVVVLLALGLLALVAASFSLAVRSQLRTTASLSASAQAEAFADAGINIAMLDLLAAREDRTRKRRFPVDGTAIGCMLKDGVSLVIGVQDEAGRVDLNAAGEVLLKALLRGSGLSDSRSSELAERILDFRDRDDERRALGAERADYTAAGLPGPKDAALDAIEEVGQVLGADAELINRMRPFVTVHSGLGGVDPKVAPASLLAILSSGYAAAGSSGTAVPPLANRGVLPAPLVEISPQQIYAIRSEVVTAEGARFVRDVTVDLGARRARSHIFRRWQRGSSAASPVPGPLPPC